MLKHVEDDEQCLRDLSGCGLIQMRRMRDVWILLTKAIGRGRKPEEPRRATDFGSTLARSLSLSLSLSLSPSPSVSLSLFLCFSISLLLLSFPSMFSSSLHFLSCLLIFLPVFPSRFGSLSLGISVTLLAHTLSPFAFFSGRKWRRLSTNPGFHRPSQRPWPNSFPSAFRGCGGRRCQSDRDHTNRSSSSPRC